MAKIVNVRCTGPNKHVNTIDWRKALEKVIVLRGKPLSEQPIPPRLVLPCRHCTEGKVILTREMVEGSIEAVREAAKQLMTGLGFLQTIYLGILGFANFIPKEMPLLPKALFLAPLLLWLVALYCSMKVLMTKPYALNLHAPEEIPTNPRKFCRKNSATCTGLLARLRPGWCSRCCC